MAEIQKNPCFFNIKIHQLPFMIWQYIKNGIIWNYLINRDLWRLVMKSNEKKYIRTLFETKNFLELYQVQAEVMNKMLSLDNQEDFEDFLEGGDSIEENVFWLHYDAVHGESLLIGGYEEDITQKVSNFLKQQLPKDIFFTIQEHLQNLYVDIDAEDNLEEKICFCNQCLADTDYLLQLKFDDTYYAGTYFLSVISR